MDDDVPLSPLLTPAQASEILGIGRTKMYEHLATGRLPSVHIGRSVRIPREALAEWIRRHTTGGEENSVPSPAGVDWRHRDGTRSR